MSEPWTVLGLILWSAGYLADKGVEHRVVSTPSTCSLTPLGATRLQLYLQFDRPLDAEELAAFKPFLLRRARREPLQYVTGRAAFRELDLVVDRRVLIPRPETEVLVEAVLQWARRGVRGRSPKEAKLYGMDLGTGSGCIALSLLAEGPLPPHGGDRRLCGRPGRCGRQRLSRGVGRAAGDATWSALGAGRFRGAL